MGDARSRTASRGGGGSPTERMAMKRARAGRAWARPLPGRSVTHFARSQFQVTLGPYLTPGVTRKRAGEIGVTVGPGVTTGAQSESRSRGPQSESRSRGLGANDARGGLGAITLGGARPRAPAPGPRTPRHSGLDRQAGPPPPSRGSARTARCPGRGSTHRVSRVPWRSPTLAWPGSSGWSRP